MLIAVVGGGRSGAAIQRALAERDARVRMLSPSTGFDALRDDAARALDGADAVIEAAGRFTLSRRRAVDFFTRSSRALARGSLRAGVGRHMLLSIVGCDRPELDGYGYLAAKARQERVCLAERPDALVVRSTQWHEFAEQNLRRLRVGPFAAVPSMRIRPVALDAVASFLAECALGSTPDGRQEIAGPQTTTLWRLTRLLRRQRGAGLPLPVPVPAPGRWGRAFREGALLPGPQARILGPSPERWLAG
ncbi:MAG: 3-beta hydroxysteroid dehydrogenase [Pseudoclavibacter sp.]|nr:3-beta hydroxysteroid dehydrogenase [Pseudoclavibacter sp.]